ncbi:MAG: hypothetical protein J0I12_06950 [Candidatus Eremiobacteraeota bacterium]|nr:hypothetical protein [Candidatus Eremiobacteraeota bacterium]
MWNLLLAAALATAGPLDSVLDQLEAAPAEVTLSVRLVPSSLDPEVMWMPLDAQKSQEAHWIPPLRLGITEQSLPEWPAQEGTSDFVWRDRLDRKYYLPQSRQFGSQTLPFEIALHTEASRSGDQSCSLQIDLSTTIVSDANAISPATARQRRRHTEGQFLAGQSLVISNLYPFEEVLPVLGDLPVLGRLFQPSTTGPMIVIGT